MKTREERIKEFDTMLRNAPEIMSPLKVAKFSPFGKNRVYEMIRTKELKAYRYTDFVYRSEIIGALKLDLYPDWAKEKFLELTKPLPFDPPQHETSEPVPIVKRRVR